MATKTWRERTIAYLEAYGFSRDYTGPQSRKYLKYSAPGDSKTYYLGKAGAVRISIHGTVSNSYSVTAAIHSRVLLWEHAQNGVYCLECARRKVDALREIHDAKEKHTL